MAEGEPTALASNAGLSGQVKGDRVDVVEVRDLAHQLSARADEIDSIVNDLTSQLDGVVWMGRDAEAFRSDWQTMHRAQLHAVANALRDASTRANANATQQEKASSS